MRRYIPFLLELKLLQERTYASKGLQCRVECARHKWKPRLDLGKEACSLPYGMGLWAGSRRASQGSELVLEGLSQKAKLQHI